MLRAIVLSLGLALLVAAQNKMQRCGRLMHGGLACCNKNVEVMPRENDFHECEQLKKKPPSCDAEICIAQKVGFASPDGTIDMKAFVDQLEKKLENEPDLFERIKDNCVSGDLGKYGKEDFCDLFKLRMCSDTQLIKSCTDWKDDGECKGMKDLATECIKEFD